MTHQHTYRLATEDLDVEMEHVICTTAPCTADYWQDQDDTGAPLPEPATPEDTSAWWARRNPYS